jgi:proteasome accessory factor C
VTAARKTKASEAAHRSLSRLERILLLVPYCVAHPGISITELAQRFGAPHREIVEDLDLLFVCGLPDYTPADLIEVSIEEEHVFIRMADYFARPLRLTRTEAIPLYLKAQALVNLLEGASNGEGTGPQAGIGELGSLRAALEKLGKALLPQEGGVAELTKRIKVQLETGEAKWLERLREAVTDHRQVDLEYYTYSRDALTRRRVDPFLVFASLGHWYLSGYCHLAQDRRLFRLDRVKTIELTDENFETPDEEAADLPLPLFYVPGPDDVEVKLRVGRAAAQSLTEPGARQTFLPVESSKEIRGGRTELVFRTSAFPWLEKLLLPFGSDVEVVEPPELAERMRETAKRILALYGPARASASKRKS